MTARFRLDPIFRLAERAKLGAMRQLSVAISDAASADREARALLDEWARLQAALRDFGRQDDATAVDQLRIGDQFRSTLRAHATVLRMLAEDALDCSRQAAERVAEARELAVHAATEYERLNTARAAWAARQKAAEARVDYRNENDLAQELWNRRRLCDEH